MQFQQVIVQVGICIHTVECSSFAFHVVSTVARVYETRAYAIAKLPSNPISLLGEKGDLETLAPP